MLCDNRSVFRSATALAVMALLASACGGDTAPESESEAEPIGTGVLTVEAVSFDFEVTTCDLDGYESGGVEFDFDVAGIGSADGRTYHVFARRSYHPDTDFWIETIDLDYQDGDESLHSLHGFAATQSEPFIFVLGPTGVEVQEPVPFVSDLVEETPAGQGTITISCS